MAQYTPVIQIAEQRCDRAASYDKKGNSRLALKHFERVLELFPAYPRAVHAKGILLHKLGQTDEAIRLVEDCLALNPNYVDALQTLGHMYRSRYRYEESVKCYEKILAIDPASHLAYFNIGQVKHRELDDKAAVHYFRKSLRINNRFVPAYLALIGIHRKQKKLIEANKLCHKVLTIDPSNSEALFLAGMVEGEYGNIHRALEMLEKVKFSESAGYVAHANKIYYLNLLPEARQEQIFNEAKLFEERYARKLHQYQRPHINCPTPERKIRIGFVSCDLKLHPVARHLRPVIRNLDRTKFELYAYNSFNVHDEVTEEFKNLFCFWRNIHEISDEKVVEMVRLDTIDILFDLSGHTGQSRLLLFARKPAPIQISWIGFFNTTGFSTMDYLISDDTTIRSDEEQWFSEEILYMPHSRFCYDPLEGILPAVAPLPAHKNKHITFGAFTKINKMNDAVLDAWARILVLLPDSRLVLKWETFNDKSAIKLITDRFSKRGVESSRLEFRTESGYLMLLQEYTDDIDIALDTFPHSGGATSCDSLLMGVPVVTYSGNIPISRQTHGFLRLLGYEEELVAFSVAEYAEKAVKLANDRDRLSQIRSELRTRFLQSPLCDGAGFTRDLEKLLRGVWQKWCEGKSVEMLLAQKPLNQNELYNEGITLMDAGANKAAISYFTKSVELNRKNDKALNNLGICCWGAGRGDMAERSWRQGIRYNKSNHDLYCNMAGVMLHKKRFAKALFYCNQGMNITLENENLFMTKAKVLQEMGRFTEARALLEFAAKKFRGVSGVHAVLGNCYVAVGNVRKAIKSYHKALAIDSTHDAAHSNILFMMNNSDRYSQKQYFNEAKKWEKQHGVPAGAQSVVRVEPGKTAGKLRVGLVSADLSMHPGGMLLLAFLQHYNRDALEVYCYYNHQRSDNYTLKFQAYSTQWCETVFMPDKELYDKIQEDNIDILIDMNGHTDRNRLRLFSMKPCAIQATWIGYFNSTGLSSIDYFISDEFTTPEWMNHYFSEKIIHLPHSRFCFTPPEYSPLVSLSPAEWQGYITFGAYNNIAKISDTTIGIWSEILKKVPKSRLILKWKSFRDSAVRESMFRRFEKEGIKRNRISLRRDIMHGQMLADYSDLDIVLDTYPFNGGMTSLEALWMGVPIVTLAGRKPASRQTGSFLRLLELEDLITYSPADYVEAAVMLAFDPERLYDIRATLRQRMKQSPLMDGELFARNVEKLLESMYQEKAGGTCRI